MDGIPGSQFRVSGQEKIGLAVPCTEFLMSTGFPDYPVPCPGFPDFELSTTLVIITRLHTRLNTLDKKLSGAGSGKNIILEIVLVGRHALGAQLRQFTSDFEKQSI